MKVALVYDRVNKWGGAERVLLALHELFPDAPLFTSVHHPKTSSWANVFAIKPSFLQNIPFAASRHEFLPLFMPVAFESFSFDAYDLVISVTSEAAKGIITKPGTVHICYCLTPTRYLWSGYETYFSNKLLKFLTQPFVTALRKWDKAAAHRPDKIIAISDEVRKRVKKYYGREAVVVYPPVMLPLTKAQQVEKKQTGDYFLIVSRLSRFTKYKRIDLAIEAFNELKLPLKIIGEGSWKKKLKSKAGQNIEFLGKVSDEELSTYYQNSKALIFPGIEDFGLTMVESQQFGKPVIAFRGGGALEIIKEGKTGLFFDTQTKKALVKAVLYFQKNTFDPKVAQKQAEQFSKAEFKKHFLTVVKQMF